MFVIVLYDLIGEMNMADEENQAENPPGQGDVEITTVFSNLDKEIKALGERKKETEDKIQGVKDHLNDLSNREIELRDKISALAKQEPKINTERIELEKKLNLVTEKLEKTKKIFGDLSSVWK